MNAKFVVATAIVVIVIYIVLGVSFAVFLPNAPATHSTYQEPASAIRASLGKSASDGRIALTLNGITNASDPATRDTWIALNANASVYSHTLTPPPGDQYLIANVTVTNVHQAQIPFTHAAFALVTPDGTAYYANYAVCSSGCDAQAFKNSTLNETFSSDMYVLFSVPAGTSDVKLVYTASDPPIVMSPT
jgi:hypothetical protein